MNQETDEARLNRPLIMGEVLLYSEENHEGQEQLITANTSHLDFPIASLRIGPKTGVTVFFEENYGGISQELTAELTSFNGSRLHSRPKSIQIWPLPGKLFSGYWAIGVGEAPVESVSKASKDENIENVYLSVAPDGVLTTSSSISVREEFQITDGFTGWASSSYLKQVTPVPPPPPGGKYRALASRVHLREGPGTGFRSLGYIQVNEIVTDLGTNDNGSWRQVLRHDGLRGWVSARYFTLLQSAPSDPGEAIPQDTTRKWYHATAKLNVREGPGTNYAIIGSLQGNEVVERVEANSDGSWLRIRRTQDSAEAALGRRKISFSVLDNRITGETAAPQGGSLSLNDFRNLTMVNEQEAGFRKFSLLSQDNQWIRYSPEGKFFLKAAEAKDRTIFCQSIKIVADETQVDELGQGEVALYENQAYWGRAWVFHTSYADFKSIAGLNDTISSIQLGPLTGATIYRGSRFIEDGDNTEGKQDVTANLSSLKSEQVGEDKVSSIEVWRIVSPGGLGISFKCSLSQDFRGAGSTFEEYSAYRTTIRLPSTVKAVEIWATDATTIWVDNQPYYVDETAPVSLQPNTFHSLVITTPAVGDSLRTPGLKLHTDAMVAHERIMIFPDQDVHHHLATLEKDELWNATYKEKDGSLKQIFERPADKTKSDQQRQDVASAQEMVTRVMATVQYSQDLSGCWQQSVSPTDDLKNKGWALYIPTYVVTAETLYTRDGPGTGFVPLGVLERNDIVVPLEFNADASWIRVRRLKDDLTGWSSSAYLKTGERYRVTGSKLHFREGPGTNFPSLGYLEFNEVVTGIGVDDTGNWRQIRRSDGRTGWSASRYFALVQPVRTSPVSTAPSALRFHELSQDEVQALHTVAESPDTDLAQGVDFSVFSPSLSDIADAIKNAISISVSTLKNMVAFSIQMAGNFVTWVVETAEQVMTIVENILQRIGLAIIDVIKWLRYVFDWEDILETRNYLSGRILDSLDDLCNKFEQIFTTQVKEQVNNFLTASTKEINSIFDTAIAALGSEPPPDAEAPNFVSTISSSVESLGIPDAMEWIFSNVMGGGFGSNDPAFNTTGSVERELSEKDKALHDLLTRLNGSWSTASAPLGVAEIITSLIRYPDKPLLAVAKLLNLLRDQVLKVIDPEEGIIADLVSGLVGLLSDLVVQAKKILTANIRIPFIADLCNWIRDSGLFKLIGKTDLLKWLGPDPGNLGFSLLDAATLVLAIPINVTCKVLFPDATFRNLSDLAQELPTPSAHFFVFTAGYICSAGASMFGMGLDCMSPSDQAAYKKRISDQQKAAGFAIEGFNLESVLEWISWSFSMASFALGWIADTLCPMNVPAGTPPAPEDSQTSTELSWPAWVNQNLRYVEGGLLCLDLACLLSAPITKRSKRLRRLKEVGGPIFGSVLGAGHIALLVSKDWDKITTLCADAATQKWGDFWQDVLTVLSTLADVVTTLPDALAFLIISNAYNCIFTVGLLAMLAALYPPVEEYRLESGFTDR